jgi:hypothetical protein
MSTAAAQAPALCARSAQGGYRGESALTKAHASEVKPCEQL